MKVAVIGGGAAGFFAAINVKENFPNASVSIYEKSNKLLSKVKISGGGRCNVTNAETSIKLLSDAYPRGGMQLKKAFREFSTQHTMDWFEARGVPLQIQEDDCVFPVSQDSQSVIDCFLNECKKFRIIILKGHAVTLIERTKDRLTLRFKDSNLKSKNFDKVIVATGGSPKRSGLEWLENMDHLIEDPVPSLFTFNMPRDPIKDLMGVVVDDPLVTIQNTKLKADGPLLITHWGMSGPAILKLSALGARILSDRNYHFHVNVNWVHQKNNELIYQDLSAICKSHPKKKLTSIRPYDLPDRLWKFLIIKANLVFDKKWGELGKKGLNKLVNIMAHDNYEVSGKTTFKQEFVTCGGVSLDSIDFETMKSNVIPNLYFAGEVLDVDGITGGYNFQSCWTTGYIAGRLG